MVVIGQHRFVQAIQWRWHFMTMNPLLRCLESMTVFELMFVSNQGRSLKVGQPSGNSFNFYPTHDGSELRFLSGRQNGNGITSIGAHWAVYHTSANSATP